jgi:hypothetical protein
VPQDEAPDESGEEPAAEQVQDDAGETEPEVPEDAEQSEAEPVAEEAEQA